MTQRKHRSVYEIKTTPPHWKCTYLTILTVNSVYKFCGMYLSYSVNFSTALVGFQYEPVRLDVNEDCFLRRKGYP